MILGLGLGLLGCPADGGGDTDGGTDGSSSGGTSSTSASASNSASETAESASESNSGTDSTSSSGGVGVSTGSADGSSSGSEGGSSTGSTGAGSSSTSGGGEQGDIYDDCPDNECLDAFECTTVPPDFPDAGANWCTQACDPKGDPCPDAASGTATPVCAFFGGSPQCALDCSDGDCPDGMECISAGPAGNVCMWPPAEM